MSLLSADWSRSEKMGLEEAARHRSESPRVGLSQLFLKQGQELESHESAIALPQSRIKSRAISPPRFVPITGQSK
jgi:hypothetical protein